MSGGTSTSWRRSRRTGSTSTSGTSSPVTTPTTSLLSEGQGRRRRLADPRRVRARRRRVDLRHALELLPRPRPHAAGGDRLARGTRARGGAPLDARRRRVGLGRRALHRRLRPPPRGHLAALAARPGHALRRGVERGGGRRCLGRGRRAAGRAPAPGRRPRALGRLPGVVRAPRRAAARRLAPESAAKPPPRWSCSPATCTTPTCARSPSGATRACGRTSSRLSARPIATRSRRASGASSGSARRTASRS